MASTPYSEKRKEQLREVHKSNQYGVPTRERACKVKQFIKNEDYPMFKCPRLINSRVDDVKVWLGPLFKAVENQVYDVDDGCVRFIKHVPIPDRPQLISNLPRDGYVYGTDYTSFEKHFTRKTMEMIEFVMYRYMLKDICGPLELNRILTTLGGTNKISSRTGLKVRLHGRRMSGEMCTSLGNGFANLILAEFIASLHSGHIVGFVEGDDGIFVTDFEMTVQDYANVGFTIKINQFIDPCEASFCGMIFSRSLQIIKDPIGFVARFGWSSSCMGCSERVMGNLLRAKALSAVYETPHCPIVGVIARQALLHTRGSLPRFVEDGYHDFSKIPRDESKLAPFAPTKDTRELFHRVFGVDTALQIECENRIVLGDHKFVSDVLMNSFQGPDAEKARNDMIWYSHTYVTEE